MTETNSVSEDLSETELMAVGPFDVSDELRPRIDELELWDVVKQMREEGYAVIRNAATPELMADLREVIHSLAKLTKPDPERGAVKLLGRDRTVDLVATLPKVMAIAETAPSCHSTRPLIRPITVSARPTKHPAIRPFTKPTSPSRKINR